MLKSWLWSLGLVMACAAAARSADDGLRATAEPAEQVVAEPVGEVLEGPVVVDAQNGRTADVERPATAAGSDRVALLSRLRDKVTERNRASDSEKRQRLEGEIRELMQQIAHGEAEAAAQTQVASTESAGDESTGDESTRDGGSAADRSRALLDMLRKKVVERNRSESAEQRKALETEIRGMMEQLARLEPESAKKVDAEAKESAGETPARTAEKPATERAKPDEPAAGTNATTAVTKPTDDQKQKEQKKERKKTGKRGKKRPSEANPREAKSGGDRHEARSWSKDGHRPRWGHGHRDRGGWHGRYGFHGSRHHGFGHYRHGRRHHHARGGHHWGHHHGHHHRGHHARGGHGDRPMEARRDADDGHRHGNGRAPEWGRGFAGRDGGHRWGGPGSGRGDRGPQSHWRLPHAMHGGMGAFWGMQRSASAHRPMMPNLTPEQIEAMKEAAKTLDKAGLVFPARMLQMHARLAAAAPKPTRKAADRAAGERGKPESEKAKPDGERNRMRRGWPQGRGMGDPGAMGWPGAGWGPQRGGPSAESLETLKKRVEELEQQVRELKAAK